MKKFSARILVLLLLLTLAFPGALAMTAAEKEQQYNLALDELEIYLETPGDDRLPLLWFISTFEELNNFSYSTQMMYYATVLNQIETGKFDVMYDMYIDRLVSNRSFCSYLETSGYHALGTPEQLKRYGEGRRAELTGNLEAAMAAYQQTDGYYDSERRYRTLYVQHYAAIYHNARELLEKNKLTEAYDEFVSCRQYEDSENYIRQIIARLGYDPAKGTPVPAVTPPPPMTKPGSSTFQIAAGQTIRVKFTAPATGVYIFTTQGSADTFGYLFSSATADTAIDSDNNSGEGSNFRIEKQLSANQTVYVGVRFSQDNQQGNVTLDVSQKQTLTLSRNFTTDRGRVTFSWSDTENNAPYTVTYQYAGASNVAQPTYCAGFDTADSTTYGTSYTTWQLIPGKSYHITVTDRHGNSTTRTYTLPTPPAFTDGKLKATSFKVYLTPRRDSIASGMDHSTATAVSALRASEIIDNRRSTDYGFRYDVDYPQLAYARTYFTQIAVIAPNGYLECEEWADVTYGTADNNRHWNLLGSLTFRSIFDANVTVPAGTWKIELYFDGMLVNRSTFVVR